MTEEELQNELVILRERWERFTQTGESFSHAHVKKWLDELTHRAGTEARTNGRRGEDR